MFSYISHRDMESWLLVLTLLLASVQNVFCLPTGAPTQACSNLMPNHGGNAATDPNTSPPSYYIVSRQLPFVDGNYMYTAGESYDSKELIYEGLIITKHHSHAGLYNVSCL